MDTTIRVTQPVNLSSLAAMQLVTQHVMIELSTQLGADTPELTVGDWIYWTVPVVFGLPGKGNLGRVGALRVDAETGEILITPQLEQELLDNARRLAQRTAHAVGV